MRASRHDGERAVTDFVLPLDVDAEEVQKAIEAKLGDGASPGSLDARSVLERLAGGRVIVPAAHLLRLGYGDFTHGKRFIHALIWQIRARRTPKLLHRRTAAAVRK